MSISPQDALPLPARPDLEQYRKLAKELVAAGRTGAGAIREWATAWVTRLVPQSGVAIAPGMPVHVERWAEKVAELAARKLAPRPRLADAQLVLARAHGFLSW